MTVNSSTVSASIGNARFAAEGPVEIVHSQFTQFLKTLKSSPLPLPEAGPVPPGVTLVRRFVTVGVATILPPDHPPAVRFVDRFGPACCTSP